MAEITTAIRGPVAGADGSTEIGIVGPITHATSSALRECLRRLTEARTPRPGRVRLDLSCCTGIDVDGMLALSVAHDTALERGIDLCLVDVPPLIARQLRQHNFDDLLADHPPDQR